MKSDTGRRDQAAHAQAVRRRWLEVVFQAVGAASLVSLVAPWFGPQIRTFLANAKWSTWASIPILAIVAVVAIAQRRFLFGRRRHLVTFPPVGIAIALALILTSTFMLLSPGAWHAIVGPGVALDLPWSIARQAAAIFAAAMVVGLWALFSTPRKQGALPPPPESNDLDARWTTWVERDDPIEIEVEDRFNLLPVAKRIVRRLGRGSTVPSIALVGPLGSGKTSVMGLVRGIINNEGDGSLRLVRVSTWGYEEPKAAVAGILDELAAAVGDEVGGMAVRDVAEGYVTAIEGLGTAGRFARLLRSGDSPREVLRRIDDVALSIGVRFVVWIDDLERFAGATEGPETSDERNRLAPIRALIRQLEDLKSFGVLVASTSVGRGFDFEKIALYVEEIPALSRECAAAVIDEARRRWRDEAISLGIVDIPRPEKPVSSAASDDDDDSDEAELAELFGRTVSPDDHLLTFCPTPRILKQGLREYRRVWEELRGEIDADDLLALSIVRAADGEAYGLLRNLADTIALTTDQQKERWGKFEGDVASSKLTELRRISLIALGRKIFPNNPSRPQSVARREPRDYWKRYESLEKPLDGQSDQPLLRALQRFNDEADPSELLDKLTAPQTSSLMESFCRELDTSQVISLFDALCARAPSSRNEPKNRAGRPPGWMALWRMTIRRPEAHEPIFERIRDRMPEMVRTNLAVAFFWNHYFACKRQSGVDAPFTAEQQQSIHELFFRELASAYRGKSAELAAALAPCSPWELRVALFDFGAPPPAWDVLSPLILDAVAADWKAVLPSLALIFIAQDLPYAPRGEGLFGARSDLLPMFLDRDPPPSWGGDVRNAVSELAEEGRSNSGPMNDVA